MSTLRRGFAVTVIVAVAVGAAASLGAAAPVQTNERCAQLEVLADDAFKAISAMPLTGGRTPDVAAKRLRSIAKGELTPRHLRRPLRQLAKVFDKVAEGGTIVDLVPLIGSVAVGILEIQQYVAQGCPPRRPGDDPPLR